MAIEILKEGAVVEDLVLSMDTSVEQDRGTVTPINASHIPYTATQSITQGLDDRPTDAEADLAYAKLNGSPTEQFVVQDGTLPEHAVSQGQMLAADEVLDLAKAEKSEVIRKGASETYIPSAGTDPVNKDYADGLISDKFLGAITVQFIARDITDTNNVTVTVTNGVITGLV